MLRHLPDDANFEQLRCVIRHTFIEVRCLEDGAPQLKRQNSDPSFTHQDVADSLLPDVKQSEESSCTEDMVELSTCAPSVADSLSQNGSIGSKSSWASRLSTSSKSSFGSTASKFFQFKTSSNSKRNSGKQAITVGAQCETISPVIVRQHESLESDVITELPIGTCFKIVEQGALPRRSKILAGNVVGWISVKTRLNEPLVIRVEPGFTSTVADFEVDGQHEVLSTVTLRAGETLDSEVITRLEPGTILKIKELGHNNKRRGKVEAQANSQFVEGWISFSTKQGELLIGKVSDKDDKAGAGSRLFGAGHAKIRTLLESARDGDLDAMKRCVEGASGLVGKLSGKPSLNSSDVRGRTALIYASAFGHKEIVDYLLSKKHEVDVNIVDDTQKTALHHASKRARKIRGKLRDITQVAIVSALVYNGAHVEAVDHHGCTPLMFAVGNNDETLAKVLLDAGANVNSRDCEGHTPLDYAKHFGYHKLLGMLIAFGAEGEDDNAEHQDCETAPDDAATRDKSPRTPSDASDEDGRATADEFENDSIGNSAFHSNGVGGVPPFVPLCAQATVLGTTPGAWQPMMREGQFLSTDATRCSPHMMPSQMQPMAMPACGEGYETSPMNMCDQGWLANPWCQNSMLGESGAEFCCSDAACETENHTTVMVANLPRELTRTDFVQDLLDGGYRGLFDFVYMPMNFRENGNFGYAFVNLVSHHVAVSLKAHMEVENAKYVEKRNVVWSNCQGYDANIERYRNSPLMHELVPMDCKPAVYDHLGVLASFPAPTKTISKPRIHRSCPKLEKPDGNGVQDSTQEDCRVERRPGRSRHRK